MNNGNNEFLFITLAISRKEKHILEKLPSYVSYIKQLSNPLNHMLS